MIIPSIDKLINHILRLDLYPIGQKRTFDTAPGGSPLSTRLGTKDELPRQWGNEQITQSQDYPITK